MIYKIYANKPQFKSVTFTSGLNIILADRSQKSGKKDSRNGVGKTTLINIIHFCLGSTLKKDQLPIDKIKDWEFFIDIELFGERIIVSRSIANPSTVQIQGNHSKLSLKTEKSDIDEHDYYTLDNWKKLLGLSLFNVNYVDKEKYTPSFRNLISYFARSGIDAYSAPFNYFRSQPAWSVQVHNAFLLGLNWKHASTAQALKDQSSAINGLDSAIKTGIATSQGELEAERLRLENSVKSEKDALVNFNVHPQYQDIQKKANKITQELHSLANRRLVLSRKCERYEESIKSEHAPSFVEVAKLYDDAGLHFTASVTKTLDEAKAFHTTVVQNRKNFLETEVVQIKNELSDIESKIESATQERSKFMSILQTHGALEEYITLQERFTEKKEHLEKVKTKIADIKEITSKKSALKTKRIELEKMMLRDYEQTRPDWELAVSKFNENSQALYHESGNLIINHTSKGYQFRVEIPRSSSEGVGKMKIFCYDLMLANIFSAKAKINFLIHDSTIFDGVDSRQTALALEHAHKKASKENFQYICAFNSDALPEKDFTSEFNVEDFVRLRLSDRKPEDSLMGFRYNE